VQGPKEFHGFHAGVYVVAVEISFKTFVIVVFKWRFEIACPTSKNHVFMYDPIFVPAELMLEEAKIPVWRPTPMAQAFAHEVVVSRDKVAVMIIVRLREYGNHIFSQGRRHSLIRVEKQNPLISEREVVQGPVFLAGKIVESSLNDAGPHLPGYIDGCVIT
jgi:hypothetical protein